MKLLSLIVVLTCLTLTAAAAGTFVDEDYTLVEGQTSAPIIDEFVEILMEEEPTTKKATTTTTTAKPVVVVEATVPSSASKTRKSSNRVRTSGGRRKQTAKPKEEGNVKAESTSPASVDTASVAILAPKNFKPTPKPVDDFQQNSQGLMEFLKKRKMERIIASTTEDPFVSILATATAPTSEEPVTPSAESSSPVRPGSPRRLPTTNRRFGNTRTTAAPTTTTTTTTTEATTVATGRRVSNNRFGASRNRPAVAATQTVQPEEPKPTVDTTMSRARLFPKRPANLRPIGNSISRRKDQASTTEAAAAVVEEEVAAVVTEVIEQVIAEPTTAAPLRRTRGRLTARLSAI